MYYATLTCRYKTLNSPAVPLPRLHHHNCLVQRVGWRGKQDEDISLLRDNALWAVGCGSLGSNARRHLVEQGKAQRSGCCILEVVVEAASGVGDCFGGGCMRVEIPFCLGCGLEFGSRLRERLGRNRGRSRRVLVPFSS